MIGASPPYARQVLRAQPALCLLLVGALGLVGCTSKPANTGIGHPVMRRLDGLLATRGPAQVPAGARLEIRVLDVSRADAPASVLAETTIAVDAHGLPATWSLGVDPAAIDTTHSYSVRATVRDGEQLLFTTDTVNSVLTREAGPNADLILVAVHPTASGPRFRVPSAITGFLALNGSQLTFSPCDDPSTARPVHDATGGAATKAVREFGGDRVGAVVRIDGDRITGLRYAGPESRDCSRLLVRGDVVARGNEPFWSVEVDGDTAVVRTPGTPEGVRYAGGAWRQPGKDTWRFVAPDPFSSRSDSLVLELQEIACADGMSGAIHPYRAALIRGGRRVTGCALEGAGAMRSN